MRRDSTALVQDVRLEVGNLLLRVVAVHPEQGTADVDVESERELYVRSVSVVEAIGESGAELHVEPNKLDSRDT